MSLRVIQPAHWAGVQKGGPDSPMVCGACPDWRACDKADKCARVEDLHENATGLVPWDTGGSS